MSPISTEERLQAIEARLKRLETFIGQSTNSQNPCYNSSLQPNHDAIPPQVQNQLKTGNWLGLIAIICFVLAGGFIVKLSFETGWLTPGRQIGLACLLGFFLIGSGLLIMGRDKAYASLLPAAGVIVLYLSVFGAHRLYFLISFPTALLSFIAISTICIWLYTVVRHEIYAVTASLGTYLAPVLLNLNTTTVFSLYYFLVASLTFAMMSWLLNSRLLILVSAYFAILMTGLIGLNLGHDRLIILISSFQFFIFIIGTYYYSYKLKQPLTAREAWGFFPVLVIFYVIEYFYINRAFPGFAPWASILLALVLIYLYSLAKRQLSNLVLASQAVIYSFVTLIFFHSFYLKILTLSLRPWLFILILFLLAFTPKRLQLGRNASFLVPAAIILAILIIEYCSMLNQLFNEPTFYWLLVSLSAFISLWLLIIRQGQKYSEQNGFLLLATAHFLGMTALYQLLVNSLAISAAWLFYAVMVISYAYHHKDKVMAKSALLILSIAAGKALLYDAASTPTGIRILCLLLTGVVLYGCGYLLKKIINWK